MPDPSIKCAKKSTIKKPPRNQKGDELKKGGLISGLFTKQPCVSSAFDFNGKAVASLSCVKPLKQNFRNQNFDIPRFISVLYGKHSLRYIGPVLWNKLDENITETSSLSKFKFHIRCKDLTELINGNTCPACVICTS